MARKRSNGAIAAKNKKSKGRKKSGAAVISRKEAVGETDTVFRATAAALRHAVARAGAAVAKNWWWWVGNGDLVPTPPSPATPPPLTGSENDDSTSPRPTGADNRDSTSPPPTGATNFASGAQASGSASAPASASTSSDAAPLLAPHPATAPPPAGTTNSGPRPASAPRATLLPSRAKRPKKTPNRGLNQEGPFSDGYHLSLLYDEDELVVVEEEDALMYAQFCSKRATALKDKRELCHICFFAKGKVDPMKKDEIEGHCLTVHRTKCGFLCEKQGCFIRTSSKKEAGRHYYYCHEQRQGWWTECLSRHGGM